MHAVLTWEASRREQSSGLNALLRMVARKQKNQLGEHLFVHQKAKKRLKLRSKGCPLGLCQVRGVRSLQGRGVAEAARWPRNPTSPFPPFQSQGSEDPLRYPAS